MAALAAPAGWAATGALGETGVLAGLGETGGAAAAFLTTNPIGWAILGTVAVGAIGYGGYKLYQNAHQQSQAKFKERTISQACSTCHDCNDLEKEIKQTRDELKQRHDEMREDKNGLYQAGDGGIPGKEYLGTWGGHQEQFEGKQRRLRRLLDAARTADCQRPNDDASQWSSRDPPTKPAP